MATKLEDGRWRVRRKERGTGKSVDEYFPRGTTKAEVDDFEAKIRSGSLSWSQVKNCPTLDDYAERWLRIYPTIKPGDPRQNSTIIKDISTLENHLLPAFGSWRLGQIEPAAILDFQAELYRQGKRPQTIRNIVSTLSAIMKLAVIERVVTYNPCSSVPRVSVAANSLHEKARINVWDFAEKGRFMNEAVAHVLQLARIAGLATAAGPRIGELEGLLGDSLNLEEGFVVWQRTFCSKERKVKSRTKNGIVRKVYLPSEIVKLLWSYRGTPADQPVFRLNFSRLGVDQLAPMCRASRVRVITPHGWRHTTATHLLKLGRPPKEVQDLLGHKSIKTTMDTYAHVFDDQRKDLTEGLNVGAAWLLDVNARVEAHAVGDAALTGFKPRMPRGSRLLRLVSQNCPNGK